MPTPITDVLRIIAEDWVNLTPPDHTEREYSYASDEVVDPKDQLSHRSFWFEAARGEVEAETSATSQVNYAIQAILVLDADGYTPEQFTEAILNEQSLLMRAVESRTDWTDQGQVQGIWSVETRTVEVTPVGEGSTSVLVLMNLTALVGES